MVNGTGVCISLMHGGADVSRQGGGVAVGYFGPELVGVRVPVGVAVDVTFRLSPDVALPQAESTIIDKVIDKSA